MQKENRLFLACIFALVATSFGFIVRALLLNTLGVVSEQFPKGGYRQVELAGEPKSGGEAPAAT